MTPTHRRPIVGRALFVITAIVLVVVAWRAVRVPPELQLSRNVRLGMTRGEVEKVLGRSNSSIGNKTETMLLYGASGIPWAFRMLKAEFFGDGGDQFRKEEWPVVIRLNKEGHVDFIQRGGEIVESAVVATRAGKSAGDLQ